ncbi:uncharacterized protein [Ptychodera flava]|uniref:uncharacterized protein n=1 Tax=Ptychodera flava TaxID=63121 RepID=UPI00396A4A4D
MISRWFIATIYSELIYLLLITIGVILHSAFDYRWLIAEAVISPVAKVTCAVLCRRIQVIARNRTYGVRSTRLEKLVLAFLILVTMADFALVIALVIISWAQRELDSGVYILANSVILLGVVFLLKVVFCSARLSTMENYGSGSSCCSQSQYSSPEHDDYVYSVSREIDEGNTQRRDGPSSYGAVAPRRQRQDSIISRGRVRELFQCAICLGDVKMPATVCTYRGGCGQIVGCSSCCDPVNQCPLCRANWPHVSERTPLKVPGLGELMGQ